MKITSISLQVRDKNRVNISVDGKYRFSLDTYQLIDLGVKVGDEFDDSEIIRLEEESRFGRAYANALAYCLTRPHSGRELKNYLFKKTMQTRGKDGNIKPGLSQSIIDRVYDRLTDKGYINDVKFAQYWIENRSVIKGVSRRKLESELRAKGVDSSIINNEFESSGRSDDSELAKIIIKKKSHYPDKQKFMMYLARQGFNYDDIKRALGEDDYSD